MRIAFKGWKANFMRRGRINSEGRKLVGGLWGGNLKIYRGRGSSRRCIWGEKMQLEWDLDTVQCEQKSIHIHRSKYIKPKYTKYFKINWRGCIWGEKMQLGWDLGNCGARGRDWCTVSKSIFALPCHLSCFTIFQNLTGGLFQKAFLPHYVSYTSKVSAAAFMLCSILYYTSKLD